MRGSLSRRAYLAEARSYLPWLEPGDVTPAPAGVRAQAVDPDGSLVDDFRISQIGPVTAVRNAPSPAATASMAIAEHIVAGLSLAAADHGADDTDPVRPARYRESSEDRVHRRLTDPRWREETPDRPWVPGARERLRLNGHREEAFSYQECIGLMDEAGVDRALIVPPSWEGDRIDYALEACEAYPERFGSWPGSADGPAKVPR